MASSRDAVADGRQAPCAPLQSIANRGYEGAASTDHDQQAQAVNLFITDMLARRLELAKGNGATAVATPFQ